MAKLRRINHRQKAASHEQSKIRVLAIERMLSYDRRITVTEILSRLDLQYDMKADRKTIYSDLCAIDRFIPLDAAPGWNGGYKKCDLLEEEDG